MNKHRRKDSVSTRVTSRVATSKSVKMDVYKGQVLEEEARGGDLSSRGGEGVRSNDIRVSALFPARENDPLRVRERKLTPLRIVRREEGGSTIKC